MADLREGNEGFRGGRGGAVEFTVNGFSFG